MFEIQVSHLIFNISSKGKKMEELQVKPFILTAILSLTLVWIMRQRYLKSSNKTKSLPSPLKLPIIGNFHQLGSLPHRNLHSLSQKHSPIMLLHFGNVPALIVSSPEWARQVMKTHDLDFASRPAYKVLQKLLYNSSDVASAPYGEYWRKMKSILVLQLLSNKRVQASRSIMAEEIALFVDKIRQAYGAVDLSAMILKLNNDSICRLAFGRKYSESENGKRFLAVLSEFMELLGSIDIGDFIPWLSWIGRVNGSDARLERVAKEMDEVLEGVVQERLEARERMDVGERNGESFVDLMLEIYDGKYDDLSIDRDSIKPLILDVFVGGTDTIYTTLEWTMAEILRHPPVMEKLQHEVRGIINRKQDITIDDIKKMHYLKAVIKETFRYHPPLPLLAPRVARNNVHINGYDVSTGTVVMINMWAIGRDPSYWDEPEKFKPERFLGSSIDYRGLDFELTPFGSGRRLCPGISYAIVTIELVLANLMLKFDWKLANGVEGKDLDMNEAPGITTHKVIPLLVVASEVE